MGNGMKENKYGLFLRSLPGTTAVSLRCPRDTMLMVPAIP